MSSIPSTRAKRAFYADYEPAERYYRLTPYGHWFDDDTLRFFGCRLGTWGIVPNGDIAFITSEQPPHGKRGYTVRILLRKRKNIDIKNVGPFCELSRSQAVCLLRNLCAGKSVGRWTLRGGDV